jgi:hypothetical protein
VTRRKEGGSGEGKEKQQNIFPNFLFCGTYLFRTFTLDHICNLFTRGVQKRFKIQNICRQNILKLLRRAHGSKKINIRGVCLLFGGGGPGGREEVEMFLEVYSDLEAGESDWDHDGDTLVGS